MTQYKGCLKRMIILNKHFFMKNEMKSFLDNLTKKFYLNNNDENLELENLLIINEPNAGRYEFHQLDKTLLKSFLKLNFNIITWNYSGYSNDEKIFCSLESVKDDLKFMIEILKKHIKIKKIYLYGKSMGGFVTIENIEHSDYTIIDRSFWNISTIPRLKFNKTIQIIFDLFTSNFFHFDKIFESKGKVCVVYDPNDEIIPLGCSVFMGIFFHLAKYFFNFSLLPSLKYKKDYFNYLRDMKLSFKTTEDILKIPRKLEKFLKGFSGGMDLKSVFEAFRNIYKILIERNLKNEILDNNFIFSEKLSTDLNDIKEHLKNNPTENHIWERKELHHEYWESVVKIYENEPELKKFLKRFKSSCEKISVCCLNLDDIFFKSNPEFSDFIMFLWIFFLFENKIKIENKKHDFYYDKHYIKNCMLKSFDVD